MKPTLVLKFRPTPKMPVGYAYTFLCRVESVESGDFAQESFLMTVLAGDTATYEALQKHGDGTPVTGRFELDRENVPHPRVPITGFVDANRTAWKLVGLE